MFFGFRMSNKTVKELRRNKGYTAAELAMHLKLDNIEVMRIDGLKLKEVPEPLHNKLVQIFKGY